MLFLLWGLINIALIFFFITTCFQATKLLREKAGTFASVIFVFGLLSFVGNNNNKDEHKAPNSSTSKTWTFVSSDSIKPSESINFRIERGLVLNFDLLILYGKDKEGQLNVPISASSITSGFVSGTRWVPTIITVDRTADNNRFSYFISGIVKWQLLGATIYTQSRDFKGTVSL